MDRYASIRSLYSAKELRDAVVEKVNEFVVNGADSISLDCLTDLDEDISIREALDSIE